MGRRQEQRRIRIARQEGEAPTANGEYAWNGRPKPRKHKPMTPRVVDTGRSPEDG